MAQRKFDIELGIIAQPKKEEKNTADRFGNDKPVIERVRKPVDPEEW